MRCGRGKSIGRLICCPRFRLQDVSDEYKPDTQFLKIRSVVGRVSRPVRGPWPSDVSLDSLLASLAQRESCDNRTGKRPAPYQQEGRQTSPQKGAGRLPVSGLYNSRSAKAARPYRAPRRELRAQPGLETRPTADQSNFKICASGLYLRYCVPSDPDSSDTAEGFAP